MVFEAAASDNCVLSGWGRFGNPIWTVGSVILFYFILLVFIVYYYFNFGLIV